MLPVFFQSSWLTLYSYPFLVGIAWGIGYLFSESMLSRFGNLKNFGKFVCLTFFASWIGAKVFFLLFSASGEMATLYIRSNAFWLGGGFVFYGGLICGVLMAFVYSKLFKRFDWANLPLLIPGFALAHGVGRLGCFLAGCCFGTLCDLPWGVHLHGEWRHPTPLYEAAGLFFLSWFFFKQIQKGKKDLLSKYFLSYALLRFLVEFFRGDKVRGEFFLGLSTSQLISVAIVVSLLMVYGIRKGKSSTTTQLF